MALLDGNRTSTGSVEPASDGHAMRAVGSYTSLGLTILGYPHDYGNPHGVAPGTTQTQRNRALSDVKSGRIRVLVVSREKAAG